MAVTVKEILTLDIMKDFKVVAGEKGLIEQISTTEILDFEFIIDEDNFRDKIFEGDSLVLSSLLFAKDNPELILEAIKKLKSLNVKALAYKPVFFKGLPAEALAYANQIDFPILEFGRDEFFEDIIFIIRNLIEKDLTLGSVEPLLGEMISREFTGEEAAAAMERINPLLRPVALAVCLRFRDLKEGQLAELIKRARPDERLRGKTFVGKLQDRLFVILSLDEESEARFKAQFEDVNIIYGFVGRSFAAGISQPCSIRNGFDRAIKEAFWAQHVAEIEKVPVKAYRNMGIYKLIASHIHSPHLISYMEDYLAPVFEEDGRDGELFHTAVEYILSKGDAQVTAGRLFCHKNTIRYRIGKLQEKLDPNSNEKEFYENLAMAIKIYLLTKDMHKIQ